MPTYEEDVFIVVHLASHRVTATVAVLDRAAGSERVVAHKGIDCRWHDLTERGRREVIADTVRLAEDSAEVHALSIFLCASDPAISSRPVVGWASTGEEIVLGEQERAWALRRARDQVTGVDREVVDVLPVHWTVRGSLGEQPVDDPVGSRGNHLTCQALVVTGRRGTTDALSRLADGAGFAFDGAIAEPVALYRGIQSRLHKRGSSLVIDCGATHTTLLVRHRDRLAHIETHPFGGDDLTRRLAEALEIDLAAAEALKHGLDVALPTRGESTEGQLHIFGDLQERDRRRDTAARLVGELVRRFLRERADELRAAGYLAQQGHIHLVGRAANLGGLVPLVRDAFDLPVVLGSGDRDRSPGDELDGILLTGMVRTAADKRRLQIAGRGSGIRKNVSGVWSWLMQKVE
jgi:cell division protein FtsA